MYYVVFLVILIRTSKSIINEIQSYLRHSVFYGTKYICSLIENVTITWNPHDKGIELISSISIYKVRVVFLWLRYTVEYVEAMLYSINSINTKLAKKNYFFYRFKWSWKKKTPFGLIRLCNWLIHLWNANESSSFNSMAFKIRNVFQIVYNSEVFFISLT